MGDREAVLAEDGYSKINLMNTLNSSQSKGVCDKASFDHQNVPICIQKISSMTGMNYLAVLLVESILSI